MQEETEKVAGNEEIQDNTGPELSRNVECKDDDMESNDNVTWRHCGGERIELLLGGRNE